MALDVDSQTGKRDSVPAWGAEGGGEVFGPGDRSGIAEGQRIRRTRRKIEEPDEFRDVVTGIELSVLFQKRASRPGFVEQIQSPRWALDFGKVQAPTRVRGAVLNGWASFCLALGPGDSIWNGQKAAPGSLGLLPPGCALDGGTLVDFHWVTAAIPPESWQGCLNLAGIRDQVPRQLTVLNLPPALFKGLRDQLISIRAAFASDAAPSRPDFLAETGSRMIETFATACGLAAKQPLVPDSMWNRSRLARAAEEWMIEHIDETVRIPELCAALRISRRELEYAFRSVFDQSPREYLETLRLHAIRRELMQYRSDGVRVIDIAYAHGMPHLGRFAASYRCLFGENPVDTLRRR